MYPRGKGKDMGRGRGDRERKGKRIKEINKGKRVKRREEGRKRGNEAADTEERLPSEKLFFPSILKR